MTDFWKPGHFKNSDNKPRRAGFELEFGNVYVKETAQALQNVLGGKISEINPFVYKIENDEKLVLFKSFEGVAEGIARRLPDGKIEVGNGFKRFEWK